MSMKLCIDGVFCFFFVFYGGEAIRRGGAVRCLSHARTMCLSHAQLLCRPPRRRACNHPTPVTPQFLVVFFFSRQKWLTNSQKGTKTPYMMGVPILKRNGSCGPCFLTPLSQALEAQKGRQQLFNKKGVFQTFFLISYMRGGVRKSQNTSTRAAHTFRSPPCSPTLYTLW